MQALYVCFEKRLCVEPFMISYVILYDKVYGLCLRCISARYIPRFLYMFFHPVRLRTITT